MTYKEKMKIGIITIVKVNNYGAELQAFALQKKLELAGFQSEIINYLYYKNWRFKDTKVSRPFVALSAKEKFAYWIKYRLLNFILEKVLAVMNGNVRRRMKRFEDFHRQNTRFSRTYHSMPQLYGERLDYDVFVAGSDQVWNPSAASSINTACFLKSSRSIVFLKTQNCDENFSEVLLILLREEARASISSLSRGVTKETHNS